MKLVRVAGLRLCLIRTSTGVYALDNACPHMGYGLVQGSLFDDTLTCEWHNWKFNVCDGNERTGQDAVQTHTVDIAADGTLTVRLSQPERHDEIARSLASLRAGIEQDYVGKVARDVIRLLRLDANPAELVWEAVQWGAPRAEYGWGHAVASATDCLTALSLYDGDSRAFPIVQAIAGISEEERRRPTQPLPEPVAESHPRAAFRAAVEAEHLELAQSLALGALASGAESSEMRQWFVEVVSDHHLSYGHGAIYVHKAFQLLEHVGWDRASVILPYLVPTIVYATREDRLPYMRPFMRTLAATDIRALTMTEAVSDWDGREQLVKSLLGADKTLFADSAIGALRRGAGVDGLLDAAVLAASERMLRYDVAGEADLSDDFGWLDITHALTYANAIRWIHAHNPGPESVRLALFACFLAHYTGRHEWHTSVGVPETIARPANEIDAYGDAAIRTSMLDPSGALIFQVHAIKLSRAASEESRRLNSFAPLDAAWRFMHTRKDERRIAAEVQQSIDFLSGRAPRD